MEKISSNSWNKFYSSENLKNKLYIPESFIARIFLSHRPIEALDDYNFENLKLLDVGAGQGRHIWFFEQLGFDVSGTEVSSAALENLRSSFPHLEFKDCPSSKINFDNELFDFVVAVNSIYYLEHEGDVIQDNLRELVRVLSPGGTLICSFVGSEHFVLASAVYLENQNALINNQDHQCDDKTIIRPVNSKSDITSTISEIEDVQVKMIGEIKDELEGKMRHLFYLVAEKED